MRRRNKIVLYIISLLVVVAISLSVICDAMVVYSVSDKLYDDVDQVPCMEYGVLLGTSPRTRLGGRDNLFFLYRVDAAEKLYKGNKINKLFISGDENSLDGVNEVVCMRDSLIARGVSPADIILDGKGYRTYDSVWRAVNLYGLRSFVVISQKFHNERAVFLASHLDSGVYDVVGYNASDVKSDMALLTYMREYLARVKVFLDMIVVKQPSSSDLYE